MSHNARTKWHRNQNSGGNAIINAIINNNSSLNSLIAQKNDQNNDKNMTQCWTPFQNPSMYFHLFCKEALRLRELSPRSTTPVHRSHVYNIGSGPKGGRTIDLFMVRRAGDKVNFSPTVSFVQIMHFTLSSTEWSHEILKTDARVVINKPTSKRTLIQICIDTKFS